MSAAAASATAPRGSVRLTPLDAARGCAMLGVCMSHFGVVIQNEPMISGVLVTVGMIASPTFIFLSGMVLGYLITVRADNPVPLRTMLIDRGLFLLTVARLAIDGAHYQQFHTLQDYVQPRFMTDTIGMALLVGVFLVPRLSKSGRLALAGFLYVGGWLVVLAWHPTPFAARFVKEILVGNTNQYTDVRQNFPVVPWFAVYVAATVLGEQIAAARHDGSLEKIGRRLVFGGPVSIIGAILLKVVYLLVRPVAWAKTADMPPLWRDLYELTTPFDKYPPGPAYLLVYGGLGVIMIGAILIASERARFGRVIETAAVVGRVSLFVFVAQFYMYYLIVPALPVPQRWLLIPYFLGSLGVLWLMAAGWGAVNGNRFFMVGYTAVVRRKATIPSVQAAD